MTTFQFSRHRVAPLLSLLVAPCLGGCLPKPGLAEHASHPLPPSLPPASSFEKVSLQARQNVSVLDIYLEPQDGFQAITSRMKGSIRGGSLMLQRDDFLALVEFIGCLREDGKDFSASRGISHQFIALTQALLTVAPKRNLAGHVYSGERYFQVSSIDAEYGEELAEALKEFVSTDTPHLFDPASRSGETFSWKTIAALLSWNLQMGTLLPQSNKESQHAFRKLQDFQVLLDTMISLRQEEEALRLRGSSQGSDKKLEKLTQKILGLEQDGTFGRNSVKHLRGFKTRYGIRGDYPLCDRETLRVLLWVGYCHKE